MVVVGGRVVVGGGCGGVVGSVGVGVGVGVVVSSIRTTAIKKKNN